MSHVEAIKRPGALASPKPEAAAFGYRVEVETEYWRVQSRWERLAKAGAALPMQRQCWLSAFYASIGRIPGVEPLLVTVVDSLSGRDLMGLPLIRQKQGRLRVVTFADRGLTDYNAPIVGPFVPRDLRNIRQIWRAVRRALPATDLVLFDRMPSHIGGKDNPLALIDGVFECGSVALQLQMPDDYEGWRNGLERRFRRELDRAWRTFNEHEDATFRLIDSSEEARDFFFGFKRHSKTSVVDYDHAYVMDQPAVRRFYDRVFADGLSDGTVRFAVMQAGDEPVAGLLMLIDGECCTFHHLATAGGRWKICSPGRLILDRAMMALHQEGFRLFDFTFGDYPYKRQFGARQVRLLDAHIAVSWRALPSIISERARHAMGRRETRRKAEQELAAYR
jgi:CelD/BcsL family acetyltransferase involved in cellulose biosynthesis